MIEVQVKVEGDDQTLTQKYLVHEEGLSLSRDDFALSEMVKKARDAFKGQVEDILIRIKFQWS